MSSKQSNQKFLVVNAMDMLKEAEKRNGSEEESESELVEKNPNEEENISTLSDYVENRPEEADALNTQANSKTNEDLTWFVSMHIFLCF